MSVSPPRAVFDCNVFLQAILNPRGPAGRCVELVLEGQIRLFLSLRVVDELLDVTSRPALLAKRKIEPERVRTLLESVLTVGELLRAIPERWSSDRDPDDAHYVNLALAADARLIVSRDLDMLDLMDAATIEGRRFRAAYPELRILTPPGLLELVDPKR